MKYFGFVYFQSERIQTDLVRKIIGLARFWRGLPPTGKTEFLVSIYFTYIC